MSLDLSLPGLTKLAVLTVRDPRRTFRKLLKLNPPQQVLWEAMILVVVLSVIFAEIGNMLVVARVGTGAEEIPQFLSPFAFGGLQLLVLIVSIVLIDRVGRAMGGKGDLSGAILAVTWLQFVMMGLQIVQTVVLLVMPGLAGVVLMAGIGLFLYLLTAFVAELHRFPSMGRTFAMIFFVMIGVALGLSFILTLAGVTVPR